MKIANAGVATFFAIVASLVSPPGLMTFAAQAAPTSAMVSAPSPESEKLEANMVQSFSGTLRCASFSMNNWLLWIEIEGFSEVPTSLDNRVLRRNSAYVGYSWNLPVDPLASNGDQNFEVSLDTSDFLTPEVRAVKARWGYYDCAGQRGYSQWGFIQTPALEIFADAQLLPVGTAPTLSFNTVVWSVFSSNQEPSRIQQPVSESGLLASAPSCQFRDATTTDLHTGQQLGSITAESTYQIVCQDAVLASSALWRTGAVTYKGSALKTHPTSVSAVSSFLYQLIDEGGFYAGVMDLESFGRDAFLFNFSNGGWGDEDWMFWFEIARPGLQNKTLECSSYGSYRLQTIPNQSLGYALGYEVFGGPYSTSELVRIFVDEYEEKCDEVLLFDSSGNPFRSEVDGLAINGTSSAAVLHAGGETISHYALPALSTESGVVHEIYAEFEQPLPAGIRLHSLRQNSEGQLIGIEVAPSKFAVHYLDLDVSGSPIAQTFNLSDSLNDWGPSGETYLVDLIFDGRYLTAHLENDSTGSVVVTFDTQPGLLVASLQNLGDQWCPISNELGYSHSNWHDMMGCRPKPIGVDREGGLLLASPDLIMLRTPTFSALSRVVLPDGNQSFLTGIDTDSLGYFVPKFAMSGTKDEISMQRDRLTFHSFDIPNRRLASQSQSPGNQQVNPPSQAPLQDPVPPGTPASDQIVEASTVKILPLGKLNPVISGEPLPLGIERSLVNRAWIGEVSVDILTSGSEAVLETSSVKSGTHDLRLETNFGSFTYMAAVEVFLLTKPRTSNQLIRFDSGITVTKIREEVLRAVANQKIDSITCAFETQRLKAVSACKRLAAALGAKSKVVRIPKKYMIRDSILIRTRGD